MSLSECCFMDDKDDVGVEVEIEESDRRPDFSLFAETPSRIVVTVAAGNERRLLALASEMDVPARVIGRVGGDRLKIACGRVRIDLPIKVIGETWRRGLERLLENGEQKRELKAES